MINEPISLEKKPKDFQPNSSFHRIAQNAAYGCRRSRGIGYYDAQVDKTFFCWNGGGMDVWTGEYDHKTGQFGENHLVVVNNMKGKWDYHNYPMMVQAPDGSPLIFYNSHGQEMHLLKGQPHSVTDEFELKTISTDLNCYPYPVVAGGDVYVLYSHNDDLSYPWRSLRYLKSSDSGKTWEGPTIIVDSQKSDPKKFDEVYMCDARYLERCGNYPPRIQFTWSMWGGRRHASQGQGAFCAYLSLEDNKIYSPAGKCMTEVLRYDDMMEHCLVSLVPSMEQITHTTHMVVSTAQPNTGQPLVVASGYTEKAESGIWCYQFNGVTWDVEQIEEGTPSLKDMSYDSETGDIMICYFMGRYAVTRRYDGGKWTRQDMAEIPLEFGTDGIPYLNFIEPHKPELFGFVATVELAQRNSNYEGIWPVYVWVKPPIES